MGPRVFGYSPRRHYAATIDGGKVLEGKAAQLRREGFGKIKIALAGTDTSSLLNILEECFGNMDLNTSQSTASTENVEKKVEEEASISPHKSQSSLPAVAVWPMQS